MTVDTRTYGVCTVMTNRLPALQALHMIPDAAKMMTAFMAGVQAGLNHFDAINLAIQGLDGDKWVTMLQKGLIATTVSITGVGKFELSSKESIERVLGEQPELLFPLIKAVWEVSLSRYFFGLESIGLSIRTGGPTESSPQNSPPSGPSPASG